MDSGVKRNNLWPFENSDDCFALKTLKVKLDEVDFSWKLLTEALKLLEKAAVCRDISLDAKISSKATIEGPVVIKSEVTIHDYARVIGPAFIGRGTIIGNNSLVRESFLGEECVVGYLVDVARSILGNSCWFSRVHIADSLLGNNVNLGGGTVLTSLRLDNKPIRIHYGNNCIETNSLKFGALIGSRTQAGVNVMTMPGVIIGRDCMIGPGVLVNRNLEDNTFCEMQQDVIFKKNIVNYSSKAYHIFRERLEEKQLKKPISHI